MIKVLVKRLDSSMPLPAYARPGDAGLDLHAAHDVTLEPGARALVATGLAVAMVDAGYRGEFKVLLVNHGAEPITLRRGERVAQLVIQRVEGAELIEVAELPASELGEGGFGSTGARRRPGSVPAAP